LTVKHLLTFFEGYYGGKYTGIFLDAMLEYFLNTSEAFIMATFKVIPKRFSNTFGKLPDIAIIENNLEEICAERGKFWEAKKIKEKKEEVELIPMGLLAEELKMIRRSKCLN